MIHIMMGEIIVVLKTHTQVEDIFYKTQSNCNGSEKIELLIINTIFILIPSHFKADFLFSYFLSHTNADTE